jgi:hypothetical protein
MVLMSWFVMTLCIYGGWTEASGQIVELECKSTIPQVASKPLNSVIECVVEANIILWARKPGDPVIDIWCEPS